MISIWDMWLQSSVTMIPSLRYAPERFIDGMLKHS